MEIGAVPALLAGTTDIYRAGLFPEDFLDLADLALDLAEHFLVVAFSLHDRVVKHNAGCLFELAFDCMQFAVRLVYG